MDSANSNQATRQVENLLRNFENNYRIFKEDNERLSAIVWEPGTNIDRAALLSYLDEVNSRNRNFLNDLTKIRNLEEDITKTFGSPLFVSILEKVTQAETIINNNIERINALESAILSSPPPPMTTTTTTMTVPTPTALTFPTPATPAVPTPAVPTPAVPTPTVPVPTVPTPTVSVPTVPTPTVPVPTVPVTPVAQVTVPPLETVGTVEAVVANEGPAVQPVGPVLTPIPTGPAVATPGWQNQIPILVPGQIVSQIPNPIVPDRFHNFATESRALTVAASTMGAVEVRPDRINCLSSMQYFAPISSPGYPPPQPVISGSY